MESLVSENNQKNLEYLLRLSIHILYILMSPELPLLLASSLNSVNHCINKPFGFSWTRLMRFMMPLHSTFSENICYDTFDNLFLMNWQI